jgi:endoribonuclease LACTB2
METGIMIELFPNINYIPGKNRSRFPYCSGLYLKGRDARVLIDAGMGVEPIAPCLTAGVDVLLLSHCHIDHRLTRRFIPQVPVWAHSDETSYLASREGYLTGTGLSRGNLDLTRKLGNMLEDLEVPVARTVRHGEKLDFGGINLEVLHTPGHTPGHVAFYFPDHNFLFTGDVDLSPFGPFYGHDFSDIEQFVSSIRLLKSKHARLVLTGHSKPLTQDLDLRFDQYEAVIQQRQDLILEELRKPVRLPDLLNRYLLYPSYPEEDFTRWFERIHIEKHLANLIDSGQVRLMEDGRWVRTDRKF